jgi:hypothetical protein
MWTIYLPNIRSRCYKGSAHDLVGFVLLEHAGLIGFNRGVQAVRLLTENNR